MMPDLGRHAAVVLSAWGLSIAALALLVWLSFDRSARARRDLERIEGKRDGR